MNCTSPSRIASSRKMILIVGVFLAVTCRASFANDQPQLAAPPDPTISDLPDPTKVSITTEDEVTLTAWYYPALSTDEKRPAIIMFHGGNRDKSRWVHSQFIGDLYSEDYHFLTVDIRGRGDSQTGDEDELQRNPSIAIRDVEAALKYMQQNDLVDTDNIALAGSSYGANLITAGITTREMPIKTILCFSATAASYKWGFLLPPRIHSIPSGMYILADQEPIQYDVITTAERLADETKGEKDVRILHLYSHALGIYELRRNELRQPIADWFRDRFAK